MKFRNFRAWVLALSAFVVVVTTGCPPPEEPYYDDDIGLEAVPVEPGAMGGRFARKMQITTQTDLPVVGTVTGGGDTYLVVTRIYDDDAMTYSEDAQVCGGLIRSETSESTLSKESWQSVWPQSPRDVTTRDVDGYFGVTDAIELWGLANLDDMWTDPLPADEVEALEEPHASHIIDMDDDGNPGMTIYVDGLVVGNFYFVQRKISSLEGVVLSADRVVGLNTTTFEQTILGAESSPVQQGYPQRQHPDPKQSWFEEIRIADGDGCDKVLEMIDDETLSKFPPF